MPQPAPRACRLRQCDVVHIYAVIHAFTQSSRDNRPFLSTRTWIHKWRPTLRAHEPCRCYPCLARCRAIMASYPSLQNNVTTIEHSPDATVTPFTGVKVDVHEYAHDPPPSEVSQAEAATTRQHPRQRNLLAQRRRYSPLNTGA